MLRRTKGVRNAREGDLEALVETAEGWAGNFVWVVVVALVVEAFAGFLPPLLVPVGEFVCNAIVAIGVALELLMSKAGTRAQSEITRRANKDAAQARDSLAALIERATWRGMIAEQAKALLEVELPKLKPEFIVFVYPIGDEEARYVANELAIPFRYHGWKVGFRAAAFVGLPIYELRVATLYDNSESPLWKGVLAAFVGAKIPFVQGEVPPASLVTAWGDVGPLPGVDVYICPKHMLHPDNMAAMRIGETTLHPAGA